MKKTLVIMAVIAVMLLVGVLSAPGQELIARNRLSLNALRAAESGDAGRMLQVVGELSVKAQERCAYYWQAGRLGQLSGALASFTDAAFTELMKCSSAHLHLLYVANPANRELASMAVDIYPLSSDAIFWFAEIVEPEDRLNATDLYQTVTELDSTNGLAWCRLGRLRREAGELEEALLALEQCCWNGDPGSHGCWGAGGVNEQLGNFTAAIEMYRFSRIAQAQSRADELENSLGQ